MTMVSRIGFFVVSTAGLALASAPTPAPSRLSAAPAGGMLDRLVGDWQMTGQVRERPTTYTLVARRVLNSRYVELHMSDVGQPPGYEARVFVGEDTVPGRVLVHWLDNTGAAFSVPAATGAISCDTVRFEFAYSNGPFRDTFVYHAPSDTWTFKLETGEKSGGWRLFADFAVRRKRLP